jgi:hypothetical protein
MLKKLVFALTLAVFAATSVSAQTKVDQYLGTWKLTSQPKNSKFKMVTLNVSVEGDAFEVEKISDTVKDGKDYSWTTIYSYKLSGATSAYLPSKRNDFASTYMRYMSDGKLRLVYNYNASSVDLESLESNSSIREDWSLSSDGRTLTVDLLNYNRASTRFVYTKQ